VSTSMSTSTSTSSSEVRDRHSYKVGGASCPLVVDDDSISSGVEVLQVADGTFLRSLLVGLYSSESDGVIIQDLSNTLAGARWHIW
jgi:hypothetical protein